VPAVAMPTFFPHAPIGFRGLPGIDNPRGGRTPGSVGIGPWDFSGAAFTNIDQLDLEGTLQERINDPSKIHQRGSSLCGPASFLFCLATRHPTLYKQFIEDLYWNGTAKIGSFEVSPGEDCREYNPGGKIAAADWVGLASIRDSENAIFDYDEVDDAFAGITLPHELAGWFRKSGLYAQVVSDCNVIATRSEENFNTALQYFRNGWNVAILIHASILQEAAFDRNPIAQLFNIPNHWVTITYDKRTQPDGRFDLAVFSWGKRFMPIPETGLIKMDQFLDSYYGYIAVK
jgi:hypothetical protein